MESNQPLPKLGLTLPQAQQTIYDFLLDIVKTWHPADVLDEFRHLFVQHIDSVSANTLPALYVILFADDEGEFRNTIKRSCYILVNNWEVARQFEYIQSLVDIFEDPLLYKQTLSPTLKRLRHWLIKFIDSQDFQELKLFAARFVQERSVNRSGAWTSRYTSYLLAPQYVNEDNPVEQRQAARSLSRRLKDRFKFDLAMYTAHSQSTLSPRETIQNPTALGDSALQLIKAIVAKRGDFSYKNLSRLFLEQMKDSSYSHFKDCLPNYLLYTVKGNPIAAQIQNHLRAKLEDLYTEFDDQPLDSSLLLRTSNRVIDCLMTENQQEPSPLFTLVLCQGNALTLAIILLKLVLISRNSNPYLEVRIADLIRYYEQFPRSQCQWVINFLEVFQVTFAIYSENIEYNLIKISTSGADSTAQRPADPNELATFRIFSQMLFPMPPDLGFDSPKPKE